MTKTESQDGWTEIKKNHWKQESTGSEIKLITTINIWGHEVRDYRGWIRLGNGRKKLIASVTKLENCKSAVKTAIAINKSMGKI